MLKKIFALMSVALLVGVALLFAASSVIPKAFGLVPLTVLSGSMEPTFSAGDLIVGEPITDPSTLKEGDIVSFRPYSGKSTLITHRLIEKRAEGGELFLVTKGDANGAIDPEIGAAQAVGKHLYTIPYVGWLAQAVPTQAKAVFGMTAGAALLIGSLLYAAIRPRLSPHRGSETEKNPRKKQHIKEGASS